MGLGSRGRQPHRCHHHPHRQGTGRRRRIITITIITTIIIITTIGCCRHLASELARRWPTQVAGASPGKTDREWPREPPDQLLASRGNTGWPAAANPGGLS